jgi:hypothetical protein
MPRLSFYDLKAKRKFSTDSYKVVTKNVKGTMRRFAVAKSPSGNDAWRVLPKK